MGLIDRIRNLIRGKEPLQLSATTQFNTTDIDKTMPFITIGSIQALLDDRDVFDRFMHFDKNQDFFKGLTPDFIAEAVKEYVDFMEDKGMKFDRKVQKRITKIEKVLPEEQRNQKPNYVHYKNINKTVLYNTAIAIATRPDQFKAFLEAQRTGQLYNNIPVGILSQYMSTELLDFAERFATNRDFERNLRFVRDKEQIVKQGSYRMNPEFRINPDFERSVYASIKQTNDPAEYALQLYNELNKRVKYNPSFFALDQDLTDQFAHDIYYKNFGETSLENNSVICKQWSELYAYMLEKSGFEAYVCGKGKHKNVKAYYGTMRIDADATNQTTSPDDPSRLTDLTRSKLGVRPAGFYAYDFSGYKPVTRNLDTIRLDYDVASYSQGHGLDEQITEIINHIDDGRDLTSLIMGLNDRTSEVGNIIKGIAFISDMLKGSKLDNLDSVAYLNCLFHSNPALYDSGRVKCTNAFYENLYTNDCNMVPILSVNQAQDASQARAEDYLYFEYIQETHDIRPISREKLIEKVVSGKYLQGRGKDDKVIVPGLPEITDQKYIRETRDRARRTRSEAELYEATYRTAQSVYGDNKTRTDDGGR